MLMRKVLWTLGILAASALVSASAGATAYQFITITDPAAPTSCNANVTCGTTIFGINDSGAIVGNIVEADGSIQGFTFSGGTFTPFAHDPNAGLFGINNAGTIVGQASASGSPGFVDNGTFTTFQAPSADPANGGTAAIGINSTGIIVGNYTDSGNTTHGFLLSGDPGSPASYTTIDPPGSTSTFANGVNDSGTIAGAFTDSTATCGTFPTNTHGFTDIGGVFATIDVPNSCETIVNGLNNSGVLAGLYRDLANNDHGFIDVGGVFITIDDPNAIEPVGGSIVEGINSFGDIIGIFDGKDGVTHGFIAVPVAEPTMMSLVGLGFFAAGAFARRRAE